MWWRKKQPEWQAKYQNGSVDYPDGTAVTVLGGRTWYITKGKAFLVPSERVLQSWHFNSVALSNQDNISKFKVGGSLGFRDGTVVKNIATGRTYLISANKTRWIVDPDVFDKYGFDRSKTIEISQEEFELHNEGEVLK